MSSCCERKTFADFNWNGCQSYEMILKYALCELCQHQVKIFEIRYHGQTKFGKVTKPLGHKYDFDKIANHIYSIRDY